MHCLRILGSELEDVTNLDTSLNCDSRLSAAWAYAAFLHLCNIHIIDFTKITF